MLILCKVVHDCLLSKALRAHCHAHCAQTLLECASYIALLDLFLISNVMKNLQHCLAMQQASTQVQMKGRIHDGART